MRDAAEINYTNHIKLGECHGHRVLTSIMRCQILETIELLFVVGEIRELVRLSSNLSGYAGFRRLGATRAPRTKKDENVISNK
jgi:hypothetical protein